MRNTAKLDKFIRVSDELKADLRQVGKKGDTYEAIIRRLLSQSAASTVKVKEKKP
jgi:transcriptional regulator